MLLTATFNVLDNLKSVLCGPTGRFDALTEKLCVSCFTAQAWPEFDLESQWTAVCCVQTLHPQIRFTPRNQFNSVLLKKSGAHSDTIRSWADYFEKTVVMPVDRINWHEDTHLHRAVCLGAYETV